MANRKHTGEEPTYTANITGRNIPTSAVKAIANHFERLAFLAQYGGDLPERANLVEIVVTGSDLKYSYVFVGSLSYSESNSTFSAEYLTEIEVGDEIPTKVTFTSSFGTSRAERDRDDYFTNYPERLEDGLSVQLISGIDMVTTTYNSSTSSWS